ncbi:MAG TPA: matrixin family metalloprotease, partial [Candidatus Angelobacter sp.]|nr:matrixin family metalloprotease [Candidatus Angelobacter sp.]
MNAHRIRIALAALGVFVFALSQVNPASAFIRITRSNASGTGVVQAHWLDSAIPVLTVIDPTNGDISSALALSTIQACAQTWNDVPSSYGVLNAVQYDPGAGHLQPALAFDGQNSIIFDTAGVNFPPGTSIIEFVRSFIDATDGHTLDADMVANDRDFFWSTSSPGLTPAPPGQISVDLQSVVTHEYGHVLGLDHTSVADCTMIPFIIGDT